MGLRNWDRAGANPLANAREITGLDGHTDVLIGVNGDHYLLLFGGILSQISASDFMV